MIKSYFVEVEQLSNLPEKSIWVVSLGFNAKMWFIIQKEEKLSNNFTKLYCLDCYSCVLENYD